MLTAVLAAAAPAWAGPARWTTGLRPRVDVGPSIGLFYPDRLAWGFHLAGEVQILTWSHGELGAGGILSAHFLPVEADELQVTFDGLDSSIGITPTLGHTFCLLDRRLLVAGLIFAGPRIRTTRSSVQDPAHGVSATHERARLFWEAGLAAWIGWRFTDHFGLRAGAAVPLIFSHDPDPYVIWQYTPRTVWLGGSYYF